MLCAVVDVAHLVATHSLQAGDHRTARAAAELACLAAPYEEIPRLDLAAVATAEGHHQEAERIATDDDEVRKEAWTSIWEEMATELPYAFLVHDRTAWATAADIHGLDDATTPEGVPLPAINRWTPFFTSVHRST